MKNQLSDNGGINLGVALDEIKHFFDMAPLLKGDLRETGAFKNAEQMVRRLTVPLNEG